MINTHTTLYTRCEATAERLAAPLSPVQGTCLGFGWWESVYHQFRSLALHFGLTVDLNRTCFSGFYHEGAGCSYAAEIDVKRLLAGLKDTGGRTVVFDNELILQELVADADVIRRLEEGVIEAQGHVRPLKNKTRIYVALEFHYPSEVENYRALDAEIERFIDTVIDLCEELNQWLFARLLHSYEYLVQGEVP
jgi:hypothetical protein